ncbi:MAG: FlgO family outer membrane protein [Candidatus Zipacnadales bacterium]
MATPLKWQAAVTFVLAATFSLSTEAAESTETWGFVVAAIGPNITLDDGTLVRLAPATRIERADHSPGDRQSIGRGSRLLVEYAADGTVARVQVFAPPAVSAVYLSNLAPARGAAYVATVVDGGRIRSRSLVLTRATYARPANWTQFRSDIRYDPGAAPGAPGAVRFSLKDSFGDLVVDRLVSAGETLPFNVGLDPNATDRLTLEVAAAGEGQLQQEWCVWLDPHFLLAPPMPTAPSLSPRTPEKLVTALNQALGETKLSGLAIAEFTPIRRDSAFLRDLQEDLLTLLGRHHRVVGVYRKRLDVGTRLSDAERQELQKLGAAYVLVGSISWRAEGTVINATVVRVEDRTIIAAVSIED